MKIACAGSSYASGGTLTVFPKGSGATQGQDATPVVCTSEGTTMSVAGNGFAGSLVCPAFDTCDFDCECRDDTGALYPCGCGINGMCHTNNAGDRRCFCEPGYTGASCTLEICPKNCNNAGTCDITTGRCVCTDPTDNSPACDGDLTFIRVWSWGDPHLRSADGLMFDFQGVPGNWWMLKSEGTRREFSMQVRPTHNAYAFPWRNGCRRVTCHRVLEWPVHDLTLV